jgi:hypothetical protein
LGRYSEAQTLLDNAAAIADKPGGEIKQLSVGLKLTMAEMALSQGRFADARTRAGNVLASVGPEFKNIVTSAKAVVGLAESYGGAAAAGKQKMLEAVDLAKQLHDPVQLASAQLGTAEAMVLAGDSPGASVNALQALEVFGRLGQQASEWRALLVAAQANQNMGDKSKAREYAMRAKDLLAKLEQRWGSENYTSYLNRSDVQRLRKQLDQLSAA